MELVNKRDQSCVKLVRSRDRPGYVRFIVVFTESAWTKQEGKIGYYENKLT